MNLLDIRLMQALTSEPVKDMSQKVKAKLKGVLSIIFLGAENLIEL